MDRNGVFGHVFEDNGEFYYYDVNQNEIIQVEAELAAVLPLYETMTESEIEAKLNDDILLSKIREVCKTIREAQREEGLFLIQRPRIVPPDPGLSETGVCDTNLQHLVLTVTDRCNLRCAYCMHGADLNWVRSHGQEPMSEETALKAVAYFLDRCDVDKKPAVSFYGGEALLEIGLIEAVIAAARSHPKGQDTIFVIDTNGVLLDTRVIDVVLREKIFLQISLDGPQEIHDRNRVAIDGGGSFTQIIECVEQVLARDVSAAERISFIATMAPPVNLAKVADFFAHFPPFIKYGIKSQPNIRVNTANLSGQNWPGLEAGAQSLFSQMTAAREKYLSVVAVGERESLSPVIRSLFENELARFHHRSRDPLGDTFTPGGNCLPGQRKLHVTANGRYQPCERTGFVMEIGDVESGIKPAEIRKLREQFHEAVQDRCGNCWALRMCGICFAVQAEHADVEDGEFPIPESACEAIRRGKDETMKMMAKILKMPEGRRAFLNNSEIT